MSIDASHSIIPSNVRETLNRGSHSVFVEKGRKSGIAVPKTLSEAHGNVLSSMKSLSAKRYVKVGDTHGKSGFSALGQILSNIGHNIRVLFKGDGNKERKALEEAVCKFEEFAKNLSKKDGEQIRKNIEDYNNLSVGAGDKKISEIHNEMKQIYHDIKNAKAMYIENKDSTFLNENEEQMLMLAKKLDEDYQVIRKTEDTQQRIDERKKNITVKYGDKPFQTLLSKALSTVSGFRGEQALEEIKKDFTYLIENTILIHADGERFEFQSKFMSYLEGKPSQLPSFADRLQIAIEDIFQMYKNVDMKLVFSPNLTEYDPIKFLHE